MLSGKALEQSIRKNGRDIATAGYFISLVFCRKGEAGGFYPERIYQMETDRALLAIKDIVEDDEVWDWPETDDGLIIERFAFAQLPHDSIEAAYLVIVKAVDPVVIRGKLRKIIEKVLGVKCR